MHSHAPHKCSSFEPRCAPPAPRSHPAPACCLWSATREAAAAPLRGGGSTAAAHEATLRPTHADGQCGAAVRAPRRTQARTNGLWHVVQRRLLLIQQAIRVLRGQHLRSPQHNGADAHTSQPEQLQLQEVAVAEAEGTRRAGAAGSPASPARAGRRGAARAADPTRRSGGSGRGAGDFWLGAARRRGCQAWHPQRTLSAAHHTELRFSSLPQRTAGMQQRCRGSQSLRHRLVLSHIANRPLRCAPSARARRNAMRLRLRTLTR
jgi:hypothetical protein